MIGLPGILVALFFCSLRYVRPNEVAFVERCGYFQAFWYSGWHLVVPFIDRIAARISLEPQIRFLPEQEAELADGTVLTADLAVTYRIENPSLYTYAIVRPVVGQRYNQYGAPYGLDSLLKSQFQKDAELWTQLSLHPKMADWPEHCVQQLNQFVPEWGMYVEEVVLQNVEERIS